MTAVRLLCCRTVVAGDGFEETLRAVNRHRAECDEPDRGDVWGVDDEPDEHVAGDRGAAVVTTPGP